MYTITVTKKGTEETTTVMSSVLSWARICIETVSAKADPGDNEVKLMKLAKAMYLFNNAANMYFGK
jgi:hypothetical protein